MPMKKIITGKQVFNFGVIFTAILMVVTCPTPQIFQLDGRSLLNLIGIYAPLKITSVNLGATYVNEAFAIQLTASGGKPPYKWYVANLPYGINLNGKTNIISGIVKTATIPNQPIQLTVVDKRGYSNAIDTTIAICDVPTIVPTIPTILPDGIVGHPYNQITIVVKGGVNGKDPFTCAP